jgi:hypothetical protein
LTLLAATLLAATLLAVTLLFLRVVTGSEKKRRAAGPGWGATRARLHQESIT